MASTHVDQARSVYLEEEIASLIPANDPEGEIARRGVLRAALRAHQSARVVELAERYLADPLASLALKATLREFRDGGQKRSE